LNKYTMMVDGDYKYSIFHAELKNDNNNS